MSEAYGWPNLARMGLEDRVAVLEQIVHGQLLPWYAREDPTGLLNEEGGDASGGIDAGEGAHPYDGQTIPLDFGVGGAGRGMDGGSGSDATVPPDPPARLQPGLAVVIAARRADQTDVQRLADTTSNSTGAVYRNVWVPPECGTPAAGDYGWLCNAGEDSAAVFLPARPRPLDPDNYGGGPGSVGSERAADAAQTDDWNASTGVGVAYTHGGRIAYNDAGDEVLYEHDRVMKVDRFGGVYSIGQESRQTKDTPEEC